MGWGRRAQSETRKEREHQGQAGQRESGEGSTPIMHFKTGHSDVMPRVGNLPAHVTGPQPKAVKATPVAVFMNDLDVVLLGSCL